MITPTPTQTQVQILPGPNVITSLSTQLIVSTYYDGQVLSSSSIVPVLVQAQDLAGSTTVGSGAIAGAVIGGCVAVLILALFVLGCARRRGPLKFLGGGWSTEDQFDEDIWQPKAHVNAEHDVLPDEKHETMSETSRHSFVPHRSVSPISSRPFSMQSLQSVATTEFGRPLSLRSSSSGHGHDWPGDVPPMPYDPRVLPPAHLGPGYPPLHSRRTSAPTLAQLAPSSHRNPRLSRHKSTSAGQLFTSIAEDDEEAHDEPESPYTPTDIDYRPAAKRASTMPDMPVIVVSQD